jgi:hypothetical protein
MTNTRTGRPAASPASHPVSRPAQPAVRTEPPALYPVRSGRREIGTYAQGPTRTVFVPAVDVTAVAMAALATAAVIAVAVSTRHRPSIGTVTMGHGGWVSLRNSTAPALRAAPPAGRPWWARLLRARPLTVAAPQKTRIRMRGLPEAG